MTLLHEREMTIYRDWQSVPSKEWPNGGKLQADADRRAKAD